MTTFSSLVKAVKRVFFSKLEVVSCLGFSEPGAPRAKEWKMGEDSYDLEGGGDGEMAFSDKSVRRGFIKKVYAIISVQVSLIRKLCFSLKKTLFSFY